MGLSLSLRQQALLPLVFLQQIAEGFVNLNKLLEAWACLAQ
jgi:hypothetical protein